MQGERGRGSEIWRRLQGQGKERERTGWESRMENIHPGGLETLWGQGEMRNIVPGSLVERERIQ
jgi:hypothetical protein